MAQSQRLICASSDVADAGRGMRFELDDAGKVVPAFVIRHQGIAYAYLNHCAHIGVELDWMHGEFFDDSGLYLVCATHGAVYHPATGLCVGGPCKGKSLQVLSIQERDCNIFLNI